MPKILILLLLFISIHLLTADIADYYTVSSSTGAYSEISGTVLPALQTDEAISDAINIGFPINVGDVAYSQVKISSNGWVGLGAVLNSANYTNALNSIFGPLLAPLWDDLALDSGSVQYTTSGTAPNRVFIVQYHHALWNYNSAFTFNFQVKIYESGNLAFCYGYSTGPPNNPSASIGMNINPQGSLNFYSISVPFSVSNQTENNTVETFPAYGTIYTFTPVVPHRINLIQNSSCEELLVNGEIPSWTEVTGTSWDRGADVTPKDGNFFFFAGGFANAELRQDVDVSSYSVAVDAGTRQFTFNGYVQSYNQVPTDRTRIVVQYLNAAKTSVLATFDTGDVMNIGSWLLQTDTRYAPAGTRFIRIRLIATRESGSDNDGYFDYLSLIPSQDAALGIPANLHITHTTGAVHLTWSAVSGAASYKIYAADNPYGNFAFVIKTGVLSWNGIDTLPNKFYRVIASTDIP